MKSIKRYQSWMLVTLGMIMLMAGYFLFDPSYEKSLKAKFYYSVGSYDKAYDLSYEAYNLEPYNRMAYSIMTQSKYALRYVNYNKEAKAYLKTISSFASQEKIKTADQMRIKMMCDIMIEKHEKMQPTILIDIELVKESRQYYKQFLQIHEQLIKTI